MFFELTDSLESDILFAMEDQDVLCVLDASQKKIVPSESVTVDEEIYYSLPEWTSGDGYELLKDFTNNLNAPLAREDLKRVLIGGRGVFRNFKNVLKSYPIVERKWHFYKNACMKKRLNEWYNVLRESWGLEKLERSEVDFLDETEELVQDDFIFHEYDSAKDRNDIEKGAFAVAQEFREQFSGEVGYAISDVWQRQSMYADDKQKYGFVCRSQSNDFTGCILFANCPSSSRKTVVLTDFFVLQNCRGLGIGKQLLLKCLTGLKEHGIQWILVINTTIPETIKPLLTQLGFEKHDFGFLVDLLQV